MYRTVPAGGVSLPLTVGVNLSANEGSSTKYRIVAGIIVNGEVKRHSTRNVAMKRVGSANSLSTKEKEKRKNTHTEKEREGKSTNRARMEVQGGREGIGGPGRAPRMRRVVGVGCEIGFSRA